MKVYKGIFSSRSLENFEFMHGRECLMIQGPSWTYYMTAHPEHGSMDTYFASQYEVLHIEEGFAELKDPGLTPEANRPMDPPSVFSSVSGLMGQSMKSITIEFN